MSLTGDEKHTISLADATEFTARYREAEGNGEFLGGYFGKSAMLEILKQDDCVGLRIYNAIDKDEKKTYVVVGVTANEKDMTEGTIAEFVVGCPPHCPEESPLAGTD